MIKLKACPFCGSRASLFRELANYKKYMVFCTCCLIETPRQYFKHKAINMWNHRVPEKEGDKQ